MPLDAPSHQEMPGRRIHIGPRNLKPGELAHIIYQNAPAEALPPNEVVQGLCEYVVRRQFVPTIDVTDIVFLMLQFLGEIKILTGNTNYYKSNAFKYIHDSDNARECFTQILENAKFWIQRFGIDFFSRNEYDRRERGQIMRSKIDDDFYLSCKGGSGMGTFSLDFAIGLSQHYHNLPSGEVWRMGVDTQATSKGTAMRIIRTGSAIKGSQANIEEKTAKYALFKKRYGLTPPRALAFLAMYIGKDLNVDEICAISSEGINNRQLSLGSVGRIQFDYTSHFKSVGFFEATDSNWLTMGNPATNFYSSLQTTATDPNGLRAHETDGMDTILKAFRGLKGIDKKGMTLTVCADQTREEILSAISSFRIIHNK